ncbi:MAG: hypothetical protein RIC56_03000 [Pseudomonadales bacterium]
MMVEYWDLVVIVSAAVGGLCLILRQGLRALQRRQMQRLASDVRALQRCWETIADVPADLLDGPFRQTIGRIMLNRLGSARRLQPQHPFLATQRAQIDRFVAEASSHGARRATETQTLSALNDLLGLLQQPGTARAVPTPERIAAEAAVSRQLTQLEFLRDQRASVESDYLRRVTRALGAGRTVAAQLPGGNRAFPTQ